MSWVRRLTPNMTESSSQQMSGPSGSTPRDLSGILTEQADQIRTLTEQLANVTQRVYQLETLVQTLCERAAAPEPSVQPPPVSPGLEVSQVPSSLLFRVADSPPPETFSGESENCLGFLLQCDLAFERSPSSFVTAASKISYIFGLLRGKALRWAETRSRQPGFLQGPLADFLTEFKLTFGRSETQADVAKRLWLLQQGRQTVADFSLDFRTIAAASTWNEDSLKGAFVQALNDRIKDQLALCPEPRTLEDLITLAITIDKRQQELRGTKRPSLTLSASAPRSSVQVRSSTQYEEPMQVDRARLTPEEREHRMRGGLCIYCGQGGHFVSKCPQHLKERAHQ
uniref:CCHC-type domain-containing protein n=1 Tax=Nothobranchius furzeri TaxID=105023 RepID=A0A8C6M1B8_NOTFU